MSSKTKMDILAYKGSLDAEELLDWIRALDTYFDYDDIKEDKKVRHVVTKLKGHATLLWDEFQADRCCKGKLMQKHRLRENEFIHDLIKVKKIREDLESHINVISLFSFKS
jgi:hypothetical protein